MVWCCCPLAPKACGVSCPSIYKPEGWCFDHLGFPVFFLPLTFLPPVFPFAVSTGLRRGWFPSNIPCPDPRCRWASLPGKTASCVTRAIERNSNGLTPGSLQDGELILPPQPAGIPSTDGPGVHGWGQPRCFHPLSAATTLWCTCLSRQGRAYSIHQWFLHLCLHVPSAGWGARHFCQSWFPPFFTTPPPSVCSPKSRLYPNQYAESQWCGGFPSFCFYWGPGELSVCLYTSQATEELPWHRVSPLALLRCRWQGIWLWDTAAI